MDSTPGCPEAPAISMDSALSVPEAKVPAGPKETGLQSAVCGAKSAGKTKIGFLRGKESVGSVY